MRPMSKELTATRSVEKAHAAIKADDLNLQEQWDAARSPFIAIANRTSTETRARRAKLFADLEAAQATTKQHRENRVLNTAGRPQATLARATANGISVDPTKTLEQVTAQAIRGSQISRPAKASKKVQPA